MAKLNRESRNKFLGRISPLADLSDEELQTQIDQSRQRELQGGVVRGLGTAANLLGQQAGLDVPQPKAPSALDELVKSQQLLIQQQKLESAKSKEEREQIKFEAEQKAQETAVPLQEKLQSEAGRVSGITQPTGQVPPTQATEKVSPGITPQDITKEATQVSTEEQVKTDLDAIQRQLGDTPLFLKSRKTTVDNTGKISQVTSEEVNPLVLKALEAKLSQEGKLEDAERNILFKGRDEQAKNQRSFDSISGLMENTVRVWKAAALEKQNIPKVGESSILRKLTEPVVSGLALEGFPFTKAYTGQKIETAMALSKIVTGGSRIIKSVINQLIKTLPDDDAIEDDMVAKIQQSFFNSATRAAGRELTEDEELQLNERLTSLIATPPAELVGAEGAEIANKASGSLKFKVNGVLVDIPFDQVEEFFSDPDLTDDDIITRVE